jgi:hypothetical protein
MDNELLRPTDVDLILAYPEGRTLKLARKNLISHIQLPDGEIRIEKSEIDRLIEQGRRSVADER